MADLSADWKRRRKKNIHNYYQDEQTLLYPQFFARIWYQENPNCQQINHGWRCNGFKLTSLLPSWDAGPRTKGVHIDQVQTRLMQATFLKLKANTWNTPTPVKKFTEALLRFPALSNLGKNKVTYKLRIKALPTNETARVIMFVYERCLLLIVVNCRSRERPCPWLYY